MSENIKANQQGLWHLLEVYDVNSIVPNMATVGMGIGEIENKSKTSRYTS